MFLRPTVVPRTNKRLSEQKEKGVKHPETNWSDLLNDKEQTVKGM